jgi:hypothetical protein
VGALLVVSGSVALATGVSVGGGVSPVVIVILWSVVAIACVGAWRGAFVPYLALTPSELVVQNRFTHTSIPIADVVGAKVGYYGVTIQRGDGRRVQAWAVQKSNLARVAGNRTRGDEVIEAIMAAIRGTRSR